MNNSAVMIVEAVLLALLRLCYPAAALPQDRPPAGLSGGRDPAYARYEEYRYAYEQYGYLFLSEETGEGIAGAEDGWSQGGGAGGAGAAAGPGGTLGAGMAGMGAGSAAGGPGVGGGLGVGGGPGTGGAAGSGAVGASGSAVAGSAAAGGGIPSGGISGLAIKKTDPTFLAQIQDYDYLMKHYYSIHASTTASRELMNGSRLLGTDLTLKQDPSVPQILIYHTHSQETYADYGPGNLGANVVENGRYLAELLRAKGWNVIHDTSTYDIQGGKLDRNKAYNYALEGITKILEEHPTIEVVLDLHRDGVGESTHLVSQVNGKPTAQIMFFGGLSRTPDGPISYLPNPNLEENLAFGFQLQVAAEDYPGFTRKIYLKGLRYNLHLKGRSALVEVGAQTNTSQEARNAMEVLAEVLNRVLQGN